MKAVHIFGELCYAHLSRLMAAGPGAPVLVCSPGGQSDLARAICGVLLARPRTVIAMGEVGSAALPVLACGGTRIVTSGTEFMWHQPYGVGLDTMQERDAAELATSLVTFRSWLHSVLGARTARPAEWWEALVAEGRDRTWSTEEARDLGLVDGVLGLDQGFDLTEAFIDPAAVPLDPSETTFDPPERDPDGHDDGGELGE